MVNQRKFNRELVGSSDTLPRVEIEGLSKKLTFGQRHEWNGPGPWEHLGKNILDKRNNKGKDSSTHLPTHPGSSVLCIFKYQQSSMTGWEWATQQGRESRGRKMKPLKRFVRICYSSEMRSHWRVSSGRATWVQSKSQERIAGDQGWDGSAIDLDQNYKETLPERPWNFLFLH